MKTKTIKSQTMRTLLLLVLFVSGFAYAQPPITTPTSYELCDNNTDGIYCSFLLSTKDAEISTQPGIQISYYLTLTDSQTGVNPISENLNFCNNYNPQTIYVRVADPADLNNPSFTNFNLVVNPSPTANQAPDMVVYENPFDGSAVFNLSNQIGSIVTSGIDLVTFYPTITDAQTNTNPIANPNAYTNQTNPQTIGVRVTNTVTDCSSITSFNLVVNASNIITPSPYEVCDDNTDGVAFFDLTSKNSEILGILNPNDYTITYFLDISFTAPIGTPNSFFTSSTIVYCKVVENAYPSNISSTHISLEVNPLPQTVPTIPNLSIIENPYDGIATFDLTVNEAFISLGQTGYNFSYYHTQADALNQTNAITPSTAYTGANQEYIWITIKSNSTGCFKVVSFKLIVNDATQIVNIPDPILKSLLLNSGINNSVARDSGGNVILVDTNGDNEIQFSEALNVYWLLVGSTGISDMTGINSFTNLTYLECNRNNLSNLNVDNLIHLQTLYANTNQIPSINLNPLTQLIFLDIGENPITTEDFSANLGLTYLSVNGCQLSSINVNFLTSLTSLACKNNVFTNIDISNLTNLTLLEIGNPQLNPVDLSTLSNLQYLYFFHGLQTTLDLSNLHNLINLTIDDSQVTTFDASNTNLTNISISNCTNLTNFNIKNGVPHGLFNSVDNCPNLLFVCCDIDEAVYYENIINNVGTNNNTNCQVNSYCSFTPGGNYNTITGTVSYDFNNNGCDVTDSPAENIKIGITNWSTVGATFTNAGGNYTFYTTLADQSITPELENPSYFNVTPLTTVVSFPNNNNLTQVQDFCITPNGNHPDLEVVLQPLTNARPGFNSRYKLVIKNKGNIAFSNWTGLTLTYNSNKMSFVSASTTPATNNPGLLDFGYSLNPFESTTIELEFNVNAPVTTNPTNIGDVLAFTANIAILGTDETPDDNTFSISQTVVGSYDPNTITCLESDTLPTSAIGEYLHYGITFENTGNYYAENVVVKDVIDTTKYDVNSIQLLNTSNPVYVRITGSVVEFIFENINLVAASGNPPVGGHGDVLFKIKSLSNLVNGDVVTKSAKIYFDYNAPIETNTAQTTYQNLSNSVHQLDSSISIYPNPTNSFVTINCNNTIKSIELYDVQGRILETSIENSTSAKLDISEKQNGIYFVKINTDNGSKVEKIVKE